MASFNQLTVIGNLTRDPELRNLPNGTALAILGIAMSHKWKTASGEQREDTCFLDCKAFGRSAEILGQYVQKGTAILLSGRLCYETWDDKQSGAKRSKHTMMIETFQFLGERQERQESRNVPKPPPTPQRPAPAPKRNQQMDLTSMRPQPKPPATDPLEDAPAVFQDADIPF